MNTEDKIKVMQAYLEDKDIEWRPTKDPNHEWDDIPAGRDPVWNWADIVYRVKSVQPYTDQLIPSRMDGSTQGKGYCAGCQRNILVWVNKTIGKRECTSCGTVKDLL